MITFRAEKEKFPARREDLDWSLIRDEEDRQFWLLPAGEGWKGYPYRSIAVDSWRIWLLGEFYGSGKPETAGALLKEIVLGKKPASLLNGHFLLLAQDSVTGGLHVWTSRFGTLHSYYASDGRRAAVGTFFPAVARAASRCPLDWQALAGFFSFGFFPQDRTHYEDVRILRPASHYVFDGNGGLQQCKSYWQWWHKPDPGRTYDETVAQFGAIFQEVIAEHIQGGRIAVPISGGLDSRSTVAAITTPGGRSPGSSSLWAYSYGYSEDSKETRIARQVAEKRRLPFNAFTITPYLFDRLDLVLGSIEGFQDIGQCRQAAVVAEIAARADYLIAAHWGDVWLDDMGLAGKPEKKTLSKEDLLDYVCRKMEKGGRGWLLEHLCRQHTGGETPQDFLREMVKREMAPLSHLEDQDFCIKAFKTTNWSFRWTEASLRMYQPGAFPRLPFYDSRISDFFCTVPSEFVMQRRLQIDYLKRFAPDLARIKWQVYDANLYHYQNFHTWLLPQRALKKGWRLLTRKKVMERNWEVQLLSPQGRQGLEQWLLRPGLKIHGLILSSEIEKLLQDFYAQPLAENRGYTVSMLLTFSVWLEKFS